LFKKLLKELQVDFNGTVCSRWLYKELMFENLLIAVDLGSWFQARIARYLKKFLQTRFAAFETKPEPLRR